jgi:putative transposase
MPGMAWDPLLGEYRKRCTRYNTPGDFHYLTFTCYRRQAFLSKERTFVWLAEAIWAARAKYHFRLVAYVFMPEHAHVLIRPRHRKYDISTILQAIKIPVGRKARDFVLREAPAFVDRMRVPTHDGALELRFWQAGGGHDRNIFTAEELGEKIHYTHLNPVRRKLVTHAIDWKWSSAADYAGVRKGPLPVDNRHLPWGPP